MNTDAAKRAAERIVGGLGYSREGDYVYVYTLKTVEEIKEAITDIILEEMSADKLRAATEANAKTTEGMERVDPEVMQREFTGPQPAIDDRFNCDCCGGLGVVGSHCPDCGIMSSSKNTVPSSGEPQGPVEEDGDEVFTPIDSGKVIEIVRKKTGNRHWTVRQINGGCTPCSPGCEHCWSAAQAHMRKKNPNPKIAARYGGLTTPAGRWNGTIRLMPQDIEKPLHVKKPTVWAIWNDLFHPGVPYRFVNDVWNMMFNCSHHGFMVLTKRADRLKEWSQIKSDYTSWPPAEIWPDWIWLGVTACNQKEADEKVPILLSIPAAHRFVSLEPLLGEIDLTHIVIKKSNRVTLGKPDVSFNALKGWYGGAGDDRTRLDLVIAGGESGRHARPAHPGWFRWLRDQCLEAETPFFLKDMHLNEPGASGRLLDGREWNG